MENLFSQRRDIYLIDGISHGIYPRHGICPIIDIHPIHCIYSTDDIYFIHGLLHGILHDIWHVFFSIRPLFFFF